MAYRIKDIPTKTASVATDDYVPIDGATNGTRGILASAFAYVGTAVAFTTVNALALTALTTGFSVAGGTTSKTLIVSNNLTLAGTDGSTLNVGAGGNLGSAAYTASTAYAPAAGSSSITTVGTLTAGAIATGFTSITGTPISGSTGSFTSSSVSGTFTNTTAASSAAFADAIAVNGTVGNYLGILFETSGSLRWRIIRDATAESGSNAGSNFGLVAYSDTGTYLGYVMQATRSTQSVNFPGGINSTTIGSANAAAATFTTVNVVNSILSTVDNSYLQVRGGATGGAQLLLFGGSSSSVNYAYLDSDVLTFRAQNGTVRGTLTSTGLNGIAIGQTTAAAGSFTTLSASSTVSCTGDSFTIGPAGSGTDVVNLSLSGGSGTGGGAQIRFYTGSTQQGVFGIKQGFLGGASTNIAMYASGGNALEFWSSGTLSGMFDTSTNFLIGGTAVSNPGWSRMCQLFSAGSPAFSLRNTYNPQQWDMAINGTTFEIYDATAGQHVLQILSGGVINFNAIGVYTQVNTSGHYFNMQIGGTTVKVLCA